MQLSYIDLSDAASFQTPLLAVATFRDRPPSIEGVPGAPVALSQQVSDAVARGDATGRTGEEVVLYGAEDGVSRVVLIGVGESEDVDAESVRRFAGRAVRVAERLRIEAVSVSLAGFDGVEYEEVAQAAAEGCGLAAWRFDELRADDEDDPRAEVRTAQIVG